MSWKSIQWEKSCSMRTEDRRTDGHYEASVGKKNHLDVTFLFFISLLIVAQHISGNHVPIIRS